MKKKKKEYRKVCRGQGMNKPLDHTNKIGHLFFFFFFESRGKSWKVFNQGILIRFYLQEDRFNTCTKNGLWHGEPRHCLALLKALE